MLTTTEICKLYSEATGNTDGDRAEESYHGLWESEEHFATDLVDELYNLDGIMACYFDYERFTRDLFSTDYFSVDTEYGLAVFRR